MAFQVPLAEEPIMPDQAWRKFKEMKGFTFKLLNVSFVLIVNPNYSPTSKMKEDLDSKFFPPYDGPKLSSWQRGFIVRNLREGWYACHSGSERCIYVCASRNTGNIDHLAHELGHAVEWLLTDNHSSTEAGALLLQEIMMPWAVANMPPEALKLLKERPPEPIPSGHKND